MLSRWTKAAIARYGAPEDSRRDNGPEVIASCMQDCSRAREIKALYIKPREPLENGTLTSLRTSCAMDTCRDESVTRLAIPGFPVTTAIGRRNRR